MESEIPELPYEETIGRPSRALPAREDGCSEEFLNHRPPAFRLGPLISSGDEGDANLNPRRDEDCGTRRPRPFRLGPLNATEEEVVPSKESKDDSSNSGLDKDCGTRRPPTFRLGPLTDPEEVVFYSEGEDISARSTPDGERGSPRPIGDVSSTILVEQRATPLPEDDYSGSPSSGYCEKGSPGSPSSLPHPLEEYVENGEMNWEDAYDNCRTNSVAIQCSMKPKDGDFTFFCDWERPRNAVIQCNIIDGWIPLVVEQASGASLMTYLGLIERKCNPSQFFRRSDQKKKPPPPLPPINSKSIGIQCLLGPRQGFIVEDKSTQVWSPTHPFNPLHAVQPPQNVAPQMGNTEQILVTDCCRLLKAQQSKSCRGFHGFSYIRESHNEDLYVKSLCGLRQVQFEELLSKMDRAMCDFAPNREALIFLLMKLKLGLSFTNLGLLLGADKAALANLFNIVVDEIHLRSDGDLFWPSRGAMKKNLPMYFRGVYERTRVMLSFLELDTERPENECERARLFCSSSMKCCYKFILGWTPLGKICFKSKPYEGRTSFSHILSDCGFLRLLSPSDLILAERISPEMAIFPKHGMEVVSPIEPLNGSVDHVNEEVARHIGRCTGRLKSMRVLDRIPNLLFKQLDSVVHVCAVLINKLPPIVRHDQPGEEEF